MEELDRLHCGEEKKLRITSRKRKGELRFLTGDEGGRNNRVLSSLR